MRPPPGTLHVEWQPAGAEIRTHPLRQHPENRRFLVRLFQTGALLWGATVIPLIALRTFDLLSRAAPAFAMVACALVALVLEFALELRRENSELRLRIRPEAAELEHRIFGIHLVTETIPFDELRRIELSAAGSLIFRFRDGRTVSEPLPALPIEAREWVIAALLEARDASGDFWRDQLRNPADRRAVEALAEISRPS